MSKLHYPPLCQNIHSPPLLGRTYLKNYRSPLLGEAQNIFPSPLMLKSALFSLNIFFSNSLETKIFFSIFDLQYQHIVLNPVINYGYFENDFYGINY